MRVLAKMSRTPYKGDAETAENERKCSFWLIGLYYGALRPLQDRSGCSAHGALRADIQGILDGLLDLDFRLVGHQVWREIQIQFWDLMIPITYIKEATF